MELFDHLLSAYQTTQAATDLLQRVLAVEKGIVTDNKDPLAMGRVKATLSELGAKTETDWLYRLIPSPLISFPVPQVGDTIAVGYFDGDPHKGFYLGLLQNNLNPAASPDSFVFLDGISSLTVTPSSITLTVGGNSYYLDATQALETVNGATRTVAVSPVHPKFAQQTYRGFDQVQAVNANGTTTTIYQDPNYNTLPTV